MRNWLTFSLLLGSSLTLSAENQDQQAAQQQLEAVGAAITEIEDWLSDANQRLSNEQSQLRDSELAYSVARDAVDSLQSEISSLQAESDSLNAKQSELITSKEEQEASLATLLRAAYIAGDRQYLKLLLNGEDIGEGRRMLNYARWLSEFQLTQIEQYETTLEGLTENQRRLQQNVDQLNSQLQELERERSNLEEIHTSRSAALIALKSSISQQNSELEQLQIDRAELTSLLEEIARAMEGIRSFADVPPFVEQRGELAPPVDGEVLSRFGESYGGGSLSRQGILLGAETGTPVHAIHGGQVVFANWFRGLGLLVVVDHGEGYVSLYGGNEALAVAAGDWIDSRTIIATSGIGSGNRPGVYFEIRLDGQAQNPENWLTR